MIMTFSEKFKHILQNRGPHSPTFPYIKPFTYVYLFLISLTNRNEGDKMKTPCGWENIATAAVAGHTGRSVGRSRDALCQ